MSSVKRLVLGAMTAVLSVGAVHAAFIPFVIRNDGGGNAPAILDNDVYVQDALEFVISAGGMKAGLGTNDINGSSIADILSLSITRYDDPTRFTAGSGPAVAPYFNVWVTDGSGNYAVLANEPSDANFQPLFVNNGNGSRTYDLSYSDLQNKVVKVYETPGWNTNSSWVHNLFGPGPLTFASVAGLTIAPPPVSYITAGNGVGGGAPDVLGTNVAYGFNWIFGDTLSNYVSGPTSEGYVVSNASATAVVPIPGAAGLGLLGMGLVGFLRRRKNNAT